MWPNAHWSITDSEIRRFIEVDTDLDHDIDGAMNMFADLVEARADRLLDAPFEMLPDAKLFAAIPNLSPGRLAPHRWGAADRSSRND